MKILTDRADGIDQVKLPTKRGQIRFWKKKKVVQRLL